MVQNTASFDKTYLQEVRTSRHNPSFPTLHLVDNCGPLPLKSLRNTGLEYLLPNSLVQARTATGSLAPRLQATQLGLVSAARGVGAPERSGSPGGPADVFLVLFHVFEGLPKELLARCGVGTAELCNHGLEVVFLKPRREIGKVFRVAVNTLGVRARVIFVEVLVHIQNEVVLWVVNLMHEVRVGKEIATPVLGPAVAAGPLGARDQDEVLGPGGTDGIDGGLVVVEDELGGHVVGLVHDAEHDALVVLESAGELGPELGKLFGGGGFCVGRVADDAASHGLLRGVIVAHVVVGVEDGI